MQPDKTSPRSVATDTGAEGLTGQDDHPKDTALLVTTLGPCACHALPDRIELREPTCDVARRRVEARRTVAAFFRRREELRQVARYWSEAA